MTAAERQKDAERSAVTMILRAAISDAEDWCGNDDNSLPIEEIHQLIDAVNAELDASKEDREALEELELKLNTPQTENFLESVSLEAVHQRERWGSDHDAGKEPSDWFWLVGYLGGKALASAIKGDKEKALHHTISTAAVLMNWHAALSGVPSSFRPGIKPPDDIKEVP